MERIEVMNVVSETEALSLTAIAKAMGKSKANIELKDIVDNLVSEGLLVENVEGRYPVYLKAKAESNSGIASESVISAITSDNMSLTAIAKAMGKSKASGELKNVVDSLVKSGEIASEDNGRFIAYSLKKTVAVSDKESKVSSFSTTPVREDIIDDVRIDKPTLPGATESMMSGYSISSDKDKNKVIITLPDGKKVKINNNDSLLIINGEPKYKVSTPLDVLSCIKEYALANGMAHFVADDIAQNKKIKTDGDIQINDNHLMFLSVKKHNKAA